MQKYWKYLVYLLKHKYWVFIGGLKNNVPFHLLVLHDLDKFLPYMFVAFSKNYYGTDEEKNENGIAYYRAWNDHQKRNKHHIEYWICLNPYSFSDNFEMYLEIPLVYVREMIADWYSAGISKKGKVDLHYWYDTHKDFMKIHPKTKKAIETYLKMKG